MKSTRTRSPGSPAPRIITYVVVVMVIFAGLTFIVACGGSTDTTSSSGSEAMSSDVAQVTMKDIAYEPASVTIKVGETVTWTNEDSVTHTVVANNGEFESGDIAPGDAFSFTFDQAGTYPYHCSIHPSMTGTVVVQ